MLHVKITGRCCAFATPAHNMQNCKAYGTTGLTSDGSHGNQQKATSRVYL